MLKKVQLYFVRHGETYFNTCQKIQGWSDSLLTNEGVNNVSHVGKTINRVPFAKVYSSDLSRAKATTAIILSENKNKQTIPLEYIPNFREQFFGSFEGDKLNIFSKLFDLKKINKTTVENDSELAKYFPEDDIMDQFKLIDPTHDAENSLEFWSRIEQGLQHVFSESQDGDKILVVTHGALIRKLATRITHSYHNNPDNASISIFEMKDNLKMTLHQYNQHSLE